MTEGWIAAFPPEADMREDDGGVRLLRLENKTRNDE